MLAFLELTPRFKKLKRRASLEFFVHLDTSQILKNFTKLCLGFSKFRILKKVIAILLPDKALKRWENENFKIPRHRLVTETDDSDLTHI